jgi:hypothetical protein
MNRRRYADTLDAVLDLDATSTARDRRLRTVLAVAADALRDGLSPQAAEIRALRAAYGPRAE